MEVSDERGAGVVYKIANSSVVKKIKGIKNIRLIAAIFIIAVALLIYSTVAAADSVGTASQTEQSASMDDEESRLAAILGGLDGVGEVEVMMTVATTKSSVCWCSPRARRTSPSCSGFSRQPLRLWALTRALSMFMQ